MLADVDLAVVAVNASGRAMARLIRSCAAGLSTGPSESFNHLREPSKTKPFGTPPRRSKTRWISS